MTKSQMPTEVAAGQASYQRRVAFLLGAVSNLMAAGGSRLYRHAFDLGLGEARLLYVLGYEPDLTAARACQIMGIDKGAVSRALATLERRQLVRAAIDAADGRQKVIHLTALGRQCRDRLMAVALDREKRLLSIFSAKEVDTLASLLTRLRTHIPSLQTTQTASFIVRMAQRTEGNRHVTRKKAKAHLA
jgi:DNA-binding MarR family transcriptional regulator